jgi:hypothetical protein
VTGATFFQILSIAALVAIMSAMLMVPTTSVAAADHTGRACWRNSRFFLCLFVSPGKSLVCGDQKSPGFSLGTPGISVVFSCLVAADSIFFFFLLLFLVFGFWFPISYFLFHS